jgi:hypothetical protein
VPQIAAGAFATSSIETASSHDKLDDKVNFDNKAGWPQAHHQSRWRIMRIQTTTSCHARGSLMTRF